LISVSDRFRKVKDTRSRDIFESAKQRHFYESGNLKIIDTGYSEWTAMFEDEILDKLQQLPDPLRKDVLEYIERLLKQHQDKPSGKRQFTFTWEGGLAELRDKTSSVELQHKALEWR